MKLWKGILLDKRTVNSRQVSLTICVNLSFVGGKTAEWLQKSSAVSSKSMGVLETPLDFVSIWYIVKNLIALSARCAALVSILLLHFWAHTTSRVSSSKTLKSSPDTQQVFLSPKT